MKKIVLTGGGTAGHVTPNIALIPALKKENYDIYYIGSYDGIEKKLIEELGIKYYGISSGKLRRYFDVKNFTDPFKVIKGYYEASKLIKNIKPDVIFSKGGFVTVPVIFAGKRNRVPTIIHESDMTPGLANRLSLPSANKICVTFPETLEHLPRDKAVLTGTPIRKELFSGSKEAGRLLCGFNSQKPILLVIGGSLGSVRINQAIRQSLPVLLDKYQIVHICGKDNVDNSINNLSGYKQFEYVKNELADIFAMSDVVISRAGANVICELLALRKPNLLIPLSAATSRGDQVLNAGSFEKQGYSSVLQDEDLTSNTLINSVNKVYDNRKKYIEAMNNSTLNDSVGNIISLIKNI